MGCPYEYYKEEETYYPRLYCNIDNKYCMYSKKCLKVEKFVSIEGELWKECYKYVENKIKSIPSGSNFVESYRPNHQGKLYLYVVIDGKVNRILSDFTEINQDYVYVKKDGDNYKLSLVPFTKEDYNYTENKKKHSYSTKSKKVKQENEE